MCDFTTFGCLVAQQRNGFAEAHNLPLECRHINNSQDANRGLYKSLHSADYRSATLHTPLITAFGGSPLVRSSKLLFPTDFSFALGLLAADIENITIVLFTSIKNLLPQ